MQIAIGDGRLTGHPSLGAHASTWQQVREQRRVLCVQGACEGPRGGAAAMKQCRPRRQRRQHPQTRSRQRNVLHRQRLALKPVEQPCESASTSTVVNGVRPLVVVGTTANDGNIIQLIAFCKIRYRLSVIMYGMFIYQLYCTEWVVLIDGR